MDVTYNRLKKRVEDRHGDVTFDKLGSIVVTCMEFVEDSFEDLNGPEKEAWVVEAVDKLWYEQTEHHIIDRKNKKKKEVEETTVGNIEELVKQLIQQVCIATKGGIRINNFRNSNDQLKRGGSVKGGLFKKKQSTVSLNSKKD